MDIETLIELEKALEQIPSNTILRRQLAKGYYGINEFETAKSHLNILIESESKDEDKLLLASCYLQIQNYSPGLVICEELLSRFIDEQIAELYVKLLIGAGQLEDAIESYQKFQKKLGNWVNSEIEHKIRIPIQATDDEDDFENSGFNPFLEKPEIEFKDVGGMEGLKEEIRFKIIEPLKNPEVYKAYGKKAGGGILMYGPPGCGKTYLSKATAGEIDSNFLSIDINDVTDMWVGNSEKNLNQKFEIARSNNPCVMFFDEIDALGSKRVDLRHSANRNVINQFLKEMDGIDSSNEGVLILGATNAPWHMDPAFLRPGRFDRIIFVPPPDIEAREKIFSILLKDKPTQNVDFQKLASKTNDFSGADIMLVIDIAIEKKLKKAVKTGGIEPLLTKDLLAARKQVRPSTKEWFNTARNYALYSNSSGLYDEIKTYLKL
ncbi:MAG: ATP-binding protein [Balneolaceae bacterium]